MFSTIEDQEINMRGEMRYALRNGNEVGPTLPDGSFTYNTGNSGNSGSGLADVLGSFDVAGTFGAIFGGINQLVNGGNTPPPGVGGGNTVVRDEPTTDLTPLWYGLGALAVLTAIGIVVWIFKKK